MPIVPMTRSKMAHIIENGKSLFKDAPSTTTGVIKAHTPITTIRLNMFEPVTLLTASVLLCAIDAATLTAVSGSEVPIATIVSPMISDGTLKRFATLELPSTNSCTEAFELETKNAEQTTFAVKFECTADLENDSLNKLDIAIYYPNAVV